MVVDDAVLQIFLVVISLLSFIDTLINLFVRIRTVKDFQEQKDLITLVNDNVEAISSRTLVRDNHKNLNHELPSGR